MKEGHHRGAQSTTVDGAAFLIFPKLSLAALVETVLGFHGTLLPFEPHQRILLAGEMKHGLGLLVSRKHPAGLEPSRSLKSGTEKRANPPGGEASG